ncbi:MAG TPA: glycosyltransferase, partial [Aggregatilineales bacterium]|nr:glycosyltransferase [Aggregatilineales bacterium]
LKPILPLNHSINKLTGHIGVYYLYWVSQEVTTHMRQNLGFPEWTRREFRQAWMSTPTLYGISEQVMPRDPHWHDKTAVAGYWIDPLPADYTPPAPLAQFLADGDAPVYIGFGSMSSNDPQATTELIMDAVKKAGVRAIIYSGWAGLSADDVPSHIFLLESAPHEWLFPRMSAVIHHGGAGTTAAALRAGVPSGVISHMADQPYWGRRVHELGVGAKFIRRHKLTSDKLAKMITTLTQTPSIKEKAQALGAKLRAEDGVENAVRVIQSWSK